MLFAGAVPSSSTHFKNSKSISKCDAKDKLRSRVDIATLQTNKRLHFNCDETKRTTSTLTMPRRAGKRWCKGRKLIINIIHVDLMCCAVNISAVTITDTLNASHLIHFSCLVFSHPRITCFHECDRCHTQHWSSCVHFKCHSMLFENVDLIVYASFQLILCAFRLAPNEQRRLHYLFVLWYCRVAAAARNSLMQPVIQTPYKLIRVWIK